MGDSGQPSNDNKPLCKYGKDCYQKNPLHLKKFKHPTTSDERNSGLKNDQDDLKRKRRNFGKKDTLEISGEKSTESNKTLKNHRRFVSNNVSDSDNENSLAGNKDNKNELSLRKRKRSVDDDDNAAESSGTNSNDNTTNDELNVKPKLITLDDKKRFIKSKFLVDMPDDFYSFWNLCEKLNSANPSDAFQNVGLKLVGPFDVLSDKFNNVPELKSDKYLLHWRYFYDPPEFQTVLKAVRGDYHIGYFRDAPNELPVFLAENKADRDGTFAKMGDNIFAAVSLYLENMLKTGDPFKKMHVAKFQSVIKAEAKELQLDLSGKTKLMEDREGTVVTRTFNNAGLVVPCNKRTNLGYRPLIISDKELKSLLDQIGKANDKDRTLFMSELQGVLTCASIAADECDFGTGLELGLDILCSGVEYLNGTASQFMATAYRLLKRNAFASIIEAHMKNRRKGSDLSVI